MTMPQLRTSVESRLTVLLLDDYELRRLGLRTLLETYPTTTVVGEAATIAGAVERVATLRPALVITAATLVDGDAVDACRRITTAAAGTRVTVLSHSPDEASTLEALRAGASGYLSPRMRAADLYREIRAIAAGESRPAMWPMPAPCGRPPRRGWMRGDPCTLTAQERRVLALVTEGRTNKEIAALALILSEKTVKNYLSNVLDKLQVSRRSQAAVLFSREPGRFPLTPAFRLRRPRFERADASGSRPLALRAPVSGWAIRDGRHGRSALAAAPRARKRKAWDTRSCWSTIRKSC
jgi:two-component system response regulator DevR